METVRGSMQDQKLYVFLSGRVDATNAAEVENRIGALVAQENARRLVLDMEKLSYISSSGLRVILKLKRITDELCIVNAHTEIYDILDMTGLTQVMDVRRAYPTVSAEGLEEIGRGANGTVYRLNEDTIIKVYKPFVSLEEIRREREMTQKALVLGLPAVIMYDLVRVEGAGYGTMFELMGAGSLAKQMAQGLITAEEAADMSVKLLRFIHSRTVSDALFPDARQTAYDWIGFLEAYLPEDRIARLKALMDAVPEKPNLLHGDYHIKNIMRQDGECLLIDMDTLCHGDPVFEFAAMYAAYVAFSCTDPEDVKDFLGIDQATADLLWKRSLKGYFETDDEALLQAAQDKAALLAYVKVLRRTIRHGGLNDEKGLALADRCKQEIDALLGRVDELCFLR